MRRAGDLRALRALLALAVGALTAAGLVWVKQQPPAYLAQVDVVLIPPEGVKPENPLAGSSAGFVDLAGIVAKSVSGASAADRDVSQGVTLLGQGLREGWIVRQPNQGNQWVYSFDRPVLDVQAAGATPEEALATADEVVERIRVDIAAREKAGDVITAQRAHLVLNPPTPAVYRFDGDRKRAFVAVLVVGLLVGLLLNGVLAGRRPRARGAHAADRPGRAGPVRPTRRLRPARNTAPGKESAVVPETAAATETAKAGAR
jgi:hypothetical protein